MSAATPRFDSGAIRPIECWSAGWQLVKGQYWLVAGMGALGILLGSFAPMGILMGPMMCGLYLALLTLMRGERIEFGMLFKGFDYFLPSLIATLIPMGLAFVVLGPALVVFFALFVVAGTAGTGSEHGAPVAAGVLIVGVALLVLLVLAGALAVGLAFMFSYPLIVEHKLPGWEACKASAFAVRRNLGGALGLLLLNMLSGMVGMLLCYFGMFLLLPLSFAATAVAYRQVFPVPAAAAA